ncbi:putative histone acetyltransferase [Trypanosoma conorhini]|uniref:Histone acetyltransferase n=1 Tax=Trypanosoma conorhini TaxID=83891 RepID=A0A3R7KUE9_9TRYP|nr:putative histone acetyltransferase [Trypanosoma conorhini]RNF01575.1 putative histone acetyltransferase [Trypanosoma conorhini]
MRDGQKCRLDVSTWDASPAKQSAACATVVGVVVGGRRHLDDPGRVLYYFHTLRVERPVGGAAAEKTGGLMHARRERREELSVGTHALNSAGGFKYTFDGWYDEIFLYKIEEEALVPVQREWRTAMEKDDAPCEVLYLCYATRPWFQSPFAALQYIQMPERHLCYSVAVCHRCISPFVSQRHLQEHLRGGYCRCRRPPGTLLYDDTVCGRRVYYVDGAKQLHYGRCLSLLGKAFIESKELECDVDICEFFVVTLPRASLPYVLGEMDEAAFRREATRFDAADWDGDVLAGYFSRTKHTPDHCLACVVTLPMFQQQGLAAFMLDVAYRLTELRQRLCGCEAACGRRGGAISRPFSPHGRALLLAFWRRRVTEALLRSAPAQPAAAADDAPTAPFSGLHARVMAGGFYIHEDDLRFFVFHDERCFYARTTPAIAVPAACPRRRAAASESADGGSDVDGGSLGFVPPPSEFIGSVLLFKRDVAEGERRPGGFDQRFWCRGADGRHPYTAALFHY